MNEICIDPQVLLFNFVIAILAGVVFGWLPALGGMDWGDGINLRESPLPESEQPVGEFRFVNPGYFQAIGLALGARPADVLGLVTGQGVKLAFAGVGIGIASALPFTRFVGTLLFGVSTTDPATFVAAALLLAAVAAAASAFPAWRASRADPVIALREE